MLQDQQDTLRSTGPDVAPRHRLGALVAALAVAALAFGLGRRRRRSSSDAGDWIATWAASPQPWWDADFFVPINVPRSLRNQTVRQIARVSLGGSRVRVELSNEYGTRAARDRRRARGARRRGLGDRAGSDRPLTFGGQASVTVPPGAPVLSDPVDLEVPAAGQGRGKPVPARDHADLDLPLGGRADGATSRARAASSGEPDFEAAQTITSRIFLSEIMVDAPPTRGRS